ncbi:extracellular solute-binding protein [Anaerocellum diazotrophicum]|uniref:Extracellular solute-binding protein family 1 n=1 Tax=Caldicellulosiruptor diazotrophicus TaxID=2806205 RepID=A0ABN6E9P4_9FIRM|nr:extracellular solute-binding protein [Caldicellulosiruptor diazotrophicus]BCS82251.1 hypothetical protein CaldiYA01_22110 [Caldicellulosiruptor diazotrophicus]
MKRHKMISKTVMLILLLSLILLNTLPNLSALGATKSTKPTLTYWVNLSGRIGAHYQNYSQLPLYQMIMKKFNVNIQFLHPPQGGETEQFNLIIATRQLPDIMEASWEGYPGGVYKAIEDRIIIKLNPYLEKYAPNLKKFLDSRPDIKKMMTLDDGTVYNFPFIRGDRILCIFYGPMIRRDWLKKLNLQVPETVDDWYKMLVTFKNNKNKLPGVKTPFYPFSILAYGTNNGNPRRTFDYCGFLVGAWGFKTDFYVENGKVKFGALHPNFKDFIAVLQKWWREGLIDPDIITTNNSGIEAKILNNQVASFLGLIGGNMGTFLANKKGTEFDLIGVPYPVLKRGQTPEFSQMDFYYRNYGAAITTACKNIPLAMKILDWAYSKEGHMAYNYGILGKTYNIIKGKIYYTDLILRDSQGPVSAISKYTRSQVDGPFIQAKEFVEQTRLPQQVEAAQNYAKSKNDKWLPPLSLTTDEAQKLSNIMNTINTYYDETFSKLITGKSNDIQGLVKTLKKMRIEEAIKIYQIAYDRYVKR